MDPPVVKIFWGDERIEENSTLVDPDNNSRLICSRSKFASLVDSNTSDSLANLSK